MRAFAEWRGRVARQWPGVRVEQVEVPSPERVIVNQQLPVKARVNLGGLAPEDVEVQVYHGTVDSLGQVPAPETAPLTHRDRSENGTYSYQGSFTCRNTGRMTD